MNELRLKVLQVIQDRNKKWPVRGCDIIRILKLKEDKNKSGAKLRQIVNGLRLEGYPICATGKGYYWPQNSLEMKEYLDSFKSRIESQMSAYKGMLKIYEEKVHTEWILAQQEQALQNIQIRTKQIALFNN